MFRNLSPAIATLLLVMVLLINLAVWGFLSYRGVGAYNVDAQQSVREQSVNGVGVVGGGPGSGK